MVQVCSQNIYKDFFFFNSYFFDSQIWLNWLMDDCHLDNIIKLLGNKYIKSNETHAKAFCEKKSAKDFKELFFRLHHIWTISSNKLQKYSRIFKFSYSLL
jgi:hypothetical protein